MPDVLHESLTAVRDAQRRETEAAGEVSAEAQRVLREVQTQERFAKEHQLDTMLVWLFDTVEHYPAWAKRDDAEKWIKVPFTDWEGGRESRTPGGRRSAIAFTADDVGYQLVLETYGHLGPSEDTNDYGTLSLSTPSEGTVLLKVSVMRDLMKEYSRWSPIETEAFRPGPWAVTLAGVYHTARLEENRSYYDKTHDAETIAKFKKDFGLS
jgi:hypothetical protein